MGNEFSGSISSIPLKQVPLAETWLATLPIATVTRLTTPPSDPTWRCAINVEYKVLFTQLISDTYQMRDYYYEYLLAIDDKLMIISWNGKASLEKVGAWKELPLSELVKLANRCAELTTYDQKPFLWRHA